MPLCTAAQRVFQNAGLGGGGPPVDAPLVDTSEQVYISSLALLKMLKHGASGRRASKQLAGVESDFVLLFALSGGLPLAGGATVARVWVSLDDPGPGSRVLSPGSHRSP